MFLKRLQDSRKEEYEDWLEKGAVPFARPAEVSAFQDEIVEFFSESGITDFASAVVEGEISASDELIEACQWLTAEFMRMFGVTAKAYNVARRILAQGSEEAERELAKLDNWNRFRAQSQGR
jgi:hypothetical protein